MSSEAMGITLFLYIVQVLEFLVAYNIFSLHKRLVINYGEGGGLQNGKIAGSKLFGPPLKTG